MKKLTINEQIYLIAIFQLGSDAYGVQIRKKIIDLSGHSLMFGTLYNTLDALAKKGYVHSAAGEATSQRGGNNKVYYSLTPEGLAALQKARELQESLWAGMPELLHPDGESR